MNETIKSFKDTKPTPDLPKPTGKVAGIPFFQQFKSIRAGVGSTVFNADISGIWLGAKTFLLAPFGVDMSGNLKASSVTITGGSITGTAISINSGTTDPDPVPSTVQLFFNTADRQLKISVSGVWEILSTVVSPSASISPSASGSVSMSPSTSQSPSASESQSISPSTSQSPSASVSGSISPSASESKSISPSSSESKSISPSASESTSISPSASASYS